MLVSDYLRDWNEDRAKYLRFQLKESIDGAAPTAIDISAATLTVNFRAWKPPALGRSAAASGFLVNTAFSKVSSGTTGKIDGYFTLTTATTLLPDGEGEVEMAVVLIDAAVSGQATPSTYRERIMVGPWTARVRATVQP